MRLAIITHFKHRLTLSRIFTPILANFAKLNGFGNGRRRNGRSQKDRSGTVNGTMNGTVEIFSAVELQRKFSNEITFSTISPPILDENDQGAKI